MAREEKAVFTNMCMVYDGQGRVLVQDRVDPGWPGLVFPGGHVEEGEPFYTSVIREVKEETGLTIEKPVLCGVKQFLREDCGRYVVFLYKTGTFSGMLRSSEEGRVFWMPLAELERGLPVDQAAEDSEAPRLAQSFKDMLPVFLREDLSEYYSRRNEDGEWEFTRF